MGDLCLRQRRRLREEQSLQTLKCKNNNLTELPQLPQSLQTLWCHNNNLTELPQQTEIYFQNNFALKTFIINYLIQNPLQITNTLISTDLQEDMLNSKLFRCCGCHYNLPECVKYKKEYYIDPKWKVCCYRFSCIRCNITLKLK